MSRGPGLGPRPGPVLGPAARARLRRSRRALRRALLLRGRLLAVLAVAAGFVAGARWAPPAAPTGVATPAAALDLPAGHRIVPGDLMTIRLPSGLRPDGVPADPRDQVLAAPVRRGEVITDARLLGPGLLRGQPATWRAVPVRIADAAAAGLVRPGERIDLLAGPGGVADLAAAADSGSLVAEAALVLAGRQDASGPGPGSVLDAAAATPTDGALLVVAVDAGTAARLAAVAGRPLTIALHGPRG